MDHDVKSYSQIVQKYIYTWFTLAQQTSSEKKTKSQTKSVGEAGSATMLSKPKKFLCFRLH